MIDYIYILTNKDKDLVKEIESKIVGLNVKDILYTKQKLKEAIAIKYQKNTDDLYNSLDNLDFTSEDDFIKTHDNFIDTEKGYRDHAVVINYEGEVVYRAPEFEKVPEYMKELFVYINENKDTNPLILGPIFHVHLSGIHPFNDGNGRMARLWMTLILTKENELFKYFPIHEKIITNRRRYYTAIEDSRAIKSPEPFINYILTIILELIDEINKDKEERNK